MYVSSDKSQHSVTGAARQPARVPPLIKHHGALGERAHTTDNYTSNCLKTLQSAASPVVCSHVRCWTFTPRFWYKLYEVCCRKQPVYQSRVFGKTYLTHEPSRLHYRSS